jgi:hypothetical protein
MENIHKINTVFFSLFAFSIFLFFFIKMGIVAFSKRKSTEPFTRIITRTILFIVPSSILISFLSAAIAFATKNENYLNFLQLDHLITYYLPPTVIFNYVLNGKNKIIINGLLLISFFIYGSTIIFNSIYFWFFNASISSIFLSLTILIASLLYLKTLSYNIPKKIPLISPVLFFVIGMFLSNCLALLNNISIMMILLSFESKSTAIVANQLLKQESILTYYLISFQFTIDIVANIIMYLFFIKGLKLSKNFFRQL